MHFSDEPDRDHRRKPEQDGTDTAGGTPRGRRRQNRPADVGNALRTVYQQTIDEEIPSEMLDLLGKLG